MTEEEFAALSSSIQLAAIQAKVKASSINAEDLLENMDEILRLHDWQLSAARNMQISLMTKILHPFSYRLRTRLLQQLCSTELSAAEEQRMKSRLSRCVSLLEFNVEVNRRWHRLLKEAVADKKVSKDQLRSLLRCSTVWSSTHSGSPDCSSRGRALPFLELLHNGLPGNGDLFLVDVHWTTKVALLILLGLAGIVLSAILWGLGLCLFYKGTKLELAFLIFATTQVGTFVCSTWFIGPRSWRAKTQLESIFPELRRIA